MEDYTGKLDLVSDEELVSELRDRFDDMVFCGRKNICKGNTKTIRYWYGDEHIARGLCMDVIDKINDDVWDDEETENLE